MGACAADAARRRADRGARRRPHKAGAHTIRLKFPANYAIPGHTRTPWTNITWWSPARSHFGMGRDADKGRSREVRRLAAGGFALMPANMNHFAYTGAQETTIMLYGQGPVEFKYVNRLTISRGDERQEVAGWRPLTISLGRPPSWGRTISTRPNSVHGKHGGHAAYPANCYPCEIRNLDATGSWPDAAESEDGRCL